MNFPVRDADERKVEDGEYFRQTCFDLMEVTSDEEVMLLPRNLEGKETAVDPSELDFVENKDGDFEAEFTTQSVADTFVDKGPALNAAPPKTKHFEGFTFVDKGHAR